MEVFKCYRWPGNVRELQNIIKRLLVMTLGDKIGVEDLPDEIATTAASCTDGDNTGFFNIRDKHIADFEKQYLTNLMKTNEGDVTKAAEQAEIPRGTLYRLLKKNNLNPSDFRN
jgi:transcriptional regulator of acetoin/glycerol metabolism